MPDSYKKSLKIGAAGTAAPHYTSDAYVGQSLARNLQNKKITCLHVSKQLYIESWHKTGQEARQNIFILSSFYRHASSFCCGPDSLELAARLSPWQWTESKLPLANSTLPQYYTTTDLYYV